MTNKMIERLQGGANYNRIMRALNNLYVSFGYEEESQGICPMDHGFILTREEWMDLAEGVNKFYERFTDQDIKEHNDEEMERHQPSARSKPEPKPRKGWVYVVQGQNNQYKIGLTTRQPSKRLAEFCPKLPFETELIMTIPSDDVMALEAHIHNRLDHLRINGEWFELDEREILWLRAGAR
jgi:hypothetical protein